MAIFSLVFFKILSVLLNVVIGFCAGRYSNVQRESIASLLFYFIAPIVFFSIPTSTKIGLSNLSITFVVFGISTIMSVITYFVYGRFWQDETKKVLAMNAGTGNAGYFMLPIAASLFDEHTLGLYMMAAVGMNLYEYSVGYHMCSQDITSTKEKFLSVLKQPMIIAFFSGCLCSSAGITIPDFLNDFTHSMRSAFSILGMIMVGLGLSTIPKFTIDKKFTMAALSSKFLFYPIAINIFILLDKIVLNYFDAATHDAMQLMSLSPMAANTIVISTIWRLNPERVATAVLISCVVGLLYIPLLSSLLISGIQ